MEKLLHLQKTVRPVPGDTRVRQGKLDSALPGALIQDNHGLHSIRNDQHTGSQPCTGTDGHERH